MKIKMCCQDMRKNRMSLEVDFEKEINVPGCCGGGIDIISDLKYCPWCGKKLELAY